MHAKPRELTIAVVGYLDSPLGVGEAARLWLRVLDAVAADVIPVSVPVPETSANHGTNPLVVPSSGTVDADVRFLCFNADEVALMLHHPLVRRVKAGYTIGIWHWETEGFPWWLRRSFRAVDEVWTASSFSQSAIARWTKKPVRSMPLPIPLPRARGRRIAPIQVPERYLFLFEFDYRSVFDRKNPLGVVKAFTRAFAPDEGPALLLKSSNQDLFPAQRDQLLKAVDGRKDVAIWDGNLSTEDNAALMARCDAYVSLHRSEGFGLTIAEAASYGKCIITTSYSGPMEFLGSERSLLVPFSLVPVDVGHYPYPASSQWAEPDLDEASKQMRWAWQHQAEARVIGAKARAIVRDEHSIAVRAKATQETLARLDYRTARGATSRDVNRGAARASWHAWAALHRQSRRLIRFAEGSTCASR
jgi:glycosyltransferase involved in cell wall biosynthesis